jgi:putative hydrolase of the HAD superfamily
MSYRLLLLDAGFTLLAPRRSLAEALSGVLAEDGHAVSDEELRAAWEVADRWFWDEYHRDGNDTWTDDGRIDDYWRSYHALMLDELGVEARRDVLDRVLASQFATDAWQLYPDVLPMLEAVRSRIDVSVGIVSDWGSNLREIIAALDLDRHLDFVLASGAVGLAKPNPAFFRVALDAVGVDAADALMVGDSYRADVRGAWNAGIDAVWLDRREGPTINALGGQPPLDALRIHGLDELPPIVAGATGRLPRGTPDAARPALPG